jgi:regulator of replication initiation timing
MLNLQELLMSYFSELEEDVKEIVSDVYALEREYSDYYESNKNLKIKIKNVIERVADFQLNSGDSR